MAFGYGVEFCGCRVRLASKNYSYTCFVVVTSVVALLMIPLKSAVDPLYHF